MDSKDLGRFLGFDISGNRFILNVMVEREVTFPNSNSKPYLRLSPHTAPDMDTPLSVGTGLQPPAL